MTYSKDSASLIVMMYVTIAHNSSCVLVDVILLDRTHGDISDSI